MPRFEYKLAGMKKSPKKSSPASSARAPRLTRQTPPPPIDTENIRDAVWRLKSERVVAAAVNLFYHQGYSRTTLEQVADALKVTKPFIYSHFKSKSDLLAEICSRAIRVSHEALDRAEAMTGTASEKLASLARDFMYTVLTHQAHAVIYYREEKELTPEGREEINNMRRTFDRRLVSLLQEGVASGEFVVEDVHLTALAIGGIVGWSQVWYRPGGRLTAAEASERIASIVLAMVQSKAAKRRKPTATT